jgi:hypothetical protein
MIRPSNNPITLLYGATSAPYSPSSPHIGVDFAPANDPSIYAPEDGKITWTDDTNDMGQALHLWAGNRHHALCHTSQRLVPNGAVVKQGQKIGVMGFSGWVVPAGPAGTHLHWALAVDGKLIDPLSTVTGGKGGQVMAAETGEKPFNNDDAFNIAKDFGSKNPDADRSAFNHAANWNDVYYGAIGIRIRQLVTDRDNATAAAGTRYDRLQYIADKLGVKNQDDWDAMTTALARILAQEPAANAGGPTPRQLAAEKVVDALETAINIK